VIDQPPPELIAGVDEDVGVWLLRELRDFGDHVALTTVELPIWDLRASVRGVMINVEHSGDEEYRGLQGRSWSIRIDLNHFSYLSPLHSLSKTSKP
jgi:hypothetical protein